MQDGKIDNYHSDNEWPDFDSDFWEDAYADFDEYTSSRPPRYKELVRTAMCICSGGVAMHMVSASKILLYFGRFPLNFEEINLMTRNLYVLLPSTT